MSNLLRKRKITDTNDMVPKISDSYASSSPYGEHIHSSHDHRIHNLDDQVKIANGLINRESIPGTKSEPCNETVECLDETVLTSLNRDGEDREKLFISVSTERTDEKIIAATVKDDASTLGDTRYDECTEDLEETTDRSLLLPDSVVRRPLFASLTPDTDTDTGLKRIKEESSVSVAFQVFLPFLVAGLGTVAAGLLLDVVQHWPVFQEVSEVFILVPALLGLKGNLEMTLASRLSTAANIGNMDCAKKQASLIIGNMVLVQAQALVVAALASVAAVVFGWVLDGHFDIHHAWLLCASSLVTASLASAILGGIMVGVILASRKMGINPDNVATPIAASLGDLTTLALLAGISSFLYKAIGTQYWIAPLICVLCVILLPLWLYISHHNQFTHNVLYTGWSPVIMAMCISSGGGLILSFVVARYHGIAVFNPVINGVGGNLVAVQASRISTHLHKVSVLGKLPAGVKYGCIKSFCVSGGHARTARVLLFMSLPGHVIFLCIISWLKAGHTSVTAVFTGFYLVAGFIQVFLLLFIANWMVHWMWKKKNDPDNFSIPYLTALGDLLGTFLLAVAFHTLWLIGDRDADVGD